MLTKWAYDGKMSKPPGIASFLKFLRKQFLFNLMWSFYFIIWLFYYLVVKFLLPLKSLFLLV